MNKGKLAEDPRGLLYEAYRIKGINVVECKTIFLDWVLGLTIDLDVALAIKAALDEYQRGHPDHPMTNVLIEGQRANVRPSGRRGGRSARKSAHSAK